MWTNHLFCSAPKVSLSTSHLVYSIFDYFLDFIEIMIFMRDTLELGCFTMCYVVRDPIPRIVLCVCIHVFIICHAAPQSHPTVSVFRSLLHFMTRFLFLALDPERNRPTISILIYFLYA